MASLRDVAHRAGVSVATASRVASGSAHVRPRDARARRARDARPALRRARTRPSRAARSACSCPSSATPSSPRSPRRWRRDATAAGFATILCNTAGSAMREVDYVHMLLERRVEGMVFICAEITDVRGEHSHYEQLLEQGARLVFVNGGLGVACRSRRSASTSARPVGSRPSTCSSSATGAIGFVAGRGLRARDAREGPRAARRRCSSRRASTPDALRRARRLHRRRRPAGAPRSLMERRTATARRRVICSNDLMAIGAMQEAAALGLRVPDDLSIVGLRRDRGRGWTQPPLTTIEQPIDEIAETAIEALAGTRSIARPSELPSYVFRPTLRLGGTTAAAVVLKRRYAVAASSPSRARSVCAGLGVEEVEAGGIRQPASPCCRPRADVRASTRAVNIEPPLGEQLAHPRRRAASRSSSASTRGASTGKITCASAPSSSTTDDLDLDRREAGSRRARRPRSPPAGCRGSRAPRAPGAVRARAGAGSRRTRRVARRPSPRRGSSTGEPMNAATNRLTGSSIEPCGVSTCWISAVAHHASRAARASSPRSGRG